MPKTIIYNVDNIYKINITDKKVSPERIAEEELILAGLITNAESRVRNSRYIKQLSSVISHQLSLSEIRPSSIKGNIKHYSLITKGSSPLLLIVLFTKYGAAKNIQDLENALSFAIAKKQKSFSRALSFLLNTVNSSPELPEVEIAARLINYLQERNVDSKKNKLKNFESDPKLTIGSSNAPTHHSQITTPESNHSNSSVSSEAFSQWMSWAISSPDPFELGIGDKIFTAKTKTTSSYASTREQKNKSSDSPEDLKIKKTSNKRRSFQSSAPDNISVVKALNSREFMLLCDSGNLRSKKTKTADNTKGEDESWTTRLLDSRSSAPAKGILV
jgi:hypothetical protein